MQENFFESECRSQPSRPSKTGTFTSVRGLDTATSTDPTSTVTDFLADITSIFALLRPNGYAGCRNTNIPNFHSYIPHSYIPHSTASG